MFSSEHNTFPGWGEPFPWNRDTTKVEAEADEAAVAALLKKVRAENAEKERRKQQQDGQEGNL